MMGNDIATKAAKRLEKNIHIQNHNNIEIPTPEQIALVLHAAADHTAIMGMLVYKYDPTSFEPTATSIGRWLHDVGYQFDDISKRNEETKE